VERLSAATGTWSKKARGWPQSSRLFKQYLDNYPISSHQLGHFFQVNGKQPQQQYKDHISDFHQWQQKEHASDWMLFPRSVTASFSIDETALTHGELYTIVYQQRGKRA
jgi:transposase